MDSGNRIIVVAVLFMLLIAGVGAFVFFNQSDEQGDNSSALTSTVDQQNDASTQNDAERSSKNSGNSSSSDSETNATSAKVSESGKSSVKGKLDPNASSNSGGGAEASDSSSLVEHPAMEELEDEGLEDFTFTITGFVRNKDGEGIEGAEVFVTQNEINRDEINFLEAVGNEVDQAESIPAPEEVPGTGEETRDAEPTVPDSDRSKLLIPVEIKKFAQSNTFSEADGSFTLKVEGKFLPEEGKSNPYFSVRLGAKKQAYRATTTPMVVASADSAQDNKIIVMTPATAAIHGTVYKAGSDNPYPGVDVTIEAESWNDVQLGKDRTRKMRATKYGADAHSVTVKTDEHGKYRIEPVIAGTYRVTASVPGDKARPFNPDYTVSDNHDESKRYAIATSVKIAENQALQVLLDHPEKFAVTFRLDADVKGDIRAEFVEAEVENEFMASASWRSGELVEKLVDGSYRLVGFTFGHSAIRIDAKGYKPLEVPLTFSGKDVDLGVLKLEKGIVVSGAVRSSKGEPIQGAQITVLPDNNFASMIFARSGMPGGNTNSVVSDAEGRWEYSGLQGGQYKLLVNHASYAPYSVAFTLEAEEEGREFDVTLFQGGTVSGTARLPVVSQLEDEDVYDMGEGVVLVDPNELSKDNSSANFFGSAFEMLLMRSSHRSQLDEKGNFKIERVPAGRYVVMALYKGIKSIRQEVQVIDGQDLNLIIEFEAFGIVEGNIIGKDGYPLANASVQLAQSIMMQGPGKTALTNEEGFYRFEDIAPGGYFIVLTNDEKRFDANFRKERSVEIKAGQVTVKDLDLSKKSGIVVHGFVRCTDGARVSKILCVRGGSSITDAREIKVKQEDGTFESDGFVAGDYYLYVESRLPGEESGESANYRIPLQIAENQSEVLIERVFSGGKVTGSIQVDGATSGLDLSAITVSFDQKMADTFGKDPFQQFVKNNVSANRDGSFTFPWLFDGQYTAKASVPGYAPASVDVIVTNGASNIVLRVSGKAGSLKFSVEKIDGNDSAGPMPPMAFAEVRVFKANGEEVKGTDEMDGMMMLGVGATHSRASLTPGQYTLELHCEYVEPYKTTFSVGPGEEAKISASLVRASTINITVENEELDGPTVATAKVTVTRSGSSEVLDYSTLFGSVVGGTATPSKTITRKGFPAGQYDVKIELKGYQPYTLTISLARSTPAERKIRLVK